MNHSTKVARAAAAAGGLLLGGAGILVASASGLGPTVFRVSQQEWANVIVALGLIGYTAALLVAVFGKRRPRHWRVEERLA